MDWLEIFFNFLITVKCGQRKKYKQKLERLKREKL